MRMLATFMVVILSACYGGTEDGINYNCASNLDCPPGTRCAGIKTQGTCPGGASGLWDEQWYFECNNQPPEGVRHFPYCVPEPSVLTCDDASCPGESLGKVCVEDHTDPGRTVCVSDDDVRGPCGDACGVGEQCVFVLRYDDDGFIGGHQCVWFPSAGA